VQAVGRCKKWNVELDQFALRRHWRAKLSRFCTICLVLRFLQNHLADRGARFPEFPGFPSGGRESKNGGERVIDFVSDARDKVPRRPFFRHDQLGAKHGGVGDVGHHDNNAAHPAVFAADGAEIAENWPLTAVSADQGQIEVIDLLAASHLGQRFAKPARRWARQLGQGVSQKPVLLKTESAQRRLA